MMRKPEDDWDRNCQRKCRKQEHGRRFRFRGPIARGEEHDHRGQGKAAAYQRLSGEWTTDVQQMQESEQHYILHGDTAEGTEKYDAGKLKRVSSQYQTYGKDSNT